MKKNMNEKMIFRARVMILCFPLSLPVLLVISYLTNINNFWMIVALFFWAFLVGISIGHLANLKRQQELIKALREKGFSDEDIQNLTKKITLP